MFSVIRTLCLNRCGWGLARVKQKKQRFQDQLYIFMDTCIWGATWALKIEGLQQALNSFYKENKGCYKIDGELKMSRIRASADWPILKCKAAATRHLVKFALKLAEENQSGNKHDRARYSLVRCLSEYYDIIATDPMFHPEASKTKIKRLGTIIFNSYKFLSVEAVENDIRAWKMPYKMHSFCHLAEDTVDLINARWVWCYSDEDLMGIVKDVAETVHTINLEENTLYKLVIFQEGC